MTKSSCDTRSPVKQLSGRDRKKTIFRRQGRFFVYIVRCADGTFYTGYTPKLRRRIALHNSGKGAKYTRARRPVKLVWHKRFKYFKLAFLEEKRIKTLSRESKVKLIAKKNQSRKLVTKLVREEK